MSLRLALCTAISPSLHPMARSIPTINCTVAGTLCLKLEGSNGEGHVIFKNMAFTGRSQPLLSIKGLASLTLANVSLHAVEEGTLLHVKDTEVLRLLNVTVTAARSFTSEPLLRFIDIQCVEVIGLVVEGAAGLGASVAVFHTTSSYNATAPPSLLFKDCEFRNIESDGVPGTSGAAVHVLMQLVTIAFGGLGGPNPSGHFQQLPFHWQRCSLWCRRRCSTDSSCAWLCCLQRFSLWHSLSIFQLLCFKALRSKATQHAKAVRCSPLTSLC